MQIHCISSLLGYTIVYLQFSIDLYEVPTQGKLLSDWRNTYRI